ncbi:hypothetical protein [uncultured Marinobacter sp.]|uniref:hypothetical protein n=1 Tax=uncultured Marinobacter sp. TaxID=187379 RepID=UPI00258B61C4|nr:hypothetical protein [uncultured Marinobacter sp.]
MANVTGDHLARVRIKNLLLRAYIGIKDEEINNQQDVVINVCLTHEVLAIVMEHKAVNWASAEIDKPHALRYAESVSVCLEARRETHKEL